MPILGITASSISGNLFSSDYESIATVTVSAAGVSSISFTSIPATYKNLQIRALTRTDRATYPFEEMRMTFNSDTATNYSYHNLDADGSTVYGNSGATQSYIQMDQAGTTTGTFFGGLVIDIIDYESTSKYKTIKALAGAMSNATYGGYIGIVSLNSGNWRSTSAITSINIKPAFSTIFTGDSSFALYGIKGV
jgi:hypothetical protein